MVAIGRAKMLTMSEIILFMHRMRFTTLRAFDAQHSIGGVVAVFFGPEVATASHETPPPTNEGAALRLVAAAAETPIDRLKEPDRRDGATR